MLIHLQIKHFAVVDALELDFSKGMSVITGETGAGKSIMLDALSVALGARADTSWIRPGCEKAEVSATFDISTLSGALLFLTDSELLDAQGDQECIIRRVIDKNGRSKAFINGRVATVAQLKLLGDYLLQIHGQHQHQLLLKPSEQLRLVDAFGQHDKFLSAVAKAYREIEKIEKEIDALKKINHNDPSRVNLLQYQVDELEKLSLIEGEWDRLNEEQKQLSNAQGDIQNLEQAVQGLNVGDANATDMLQKAQQLLSELQLRHPSLVGVLDLLKSSQIHLEEACNELDHYLGGLEVNPQRLHEVEARLSAIFDIARKHKVEPSQLQALHAQLAKELEALDSFDETLKQKHLELEQAQAYYMKHATQLTKARTKAGKTFAKEVSAWLEPLGIKGGLFDMQWEAHAKPFGPFGIESVHFVVRTNPGHPLAPLQKVVSGGELSRISLAIALITGRYQSTPTLIFDEVDVGVGGKIGAIIGQALKQLGQDVQVFCITHLAQVAAQGCHHFQVIKSTNKNSTSTTIQPLSQAKRVEEIARMLGGMDTTKQAKAHAKELLAES